jgi:hypothetical protein
MTLRIVGSSPAPGVVMQIAYGLLGGIGLGTIYLVAIVSAALFMKNPPDGSLDRTAGPRAQPECRGPSALTCLPESPAATASKRSWHARGREHVVRQNPNVLSSG